MSDPAQDSNLKWMEITPGSANSPKWNGVLAAFDNAGETRDNYVLRLGANVTYSGTREDTSKALIALELEDFYETGGSTFQEWHVAHLGTGGTLIRPFTTAIKSDSSTVSTSLNFSQLALYALTDTSNPKWQISSGTGYSLYRYSTTADELLTLVSAEGNSGTYNVLQFQKAATALGEYANILGKLRISRNGEIATNGVSPQSGVGLYLHAPGSMQGLEVSGNSSNIIAHFSSGTSEVLIQANETQFRNTHDATFYSGNGTGEVYRVAGATGNTTQTTANGAVWTHGVVSELLTLSTSGATTNTSANLLPANSIIEAVLVRVTTTITTAVSFSVGDSTTAARFSASAGGMTAGSTRVGIDHWSGAVTILAAGPSQSSAATVRITCNATPGAGAVRVTVYYRTLTAPTS